MKIIIVGATGTIGKAVVNELKSRHEIIAAGSKSGDVQVDIADSSSIQAMYKKIGKFDALVATAGKVHFGVLAEMQAEDFYIGIKNKLMGQVNLVLQGLQYINDNGSFTLTSGILNHDPIRLGASAAMVNGGLEGFVKAAAIEMPRGIRINIISPTVVKESMPDYAEFFRGYEPVKAVQVALAYSKSVEGAQTGQTFKVGY